MRNTVLNCSISLGTLSLVKGRCVETGTIDLFIRAPQTLIKLNWPRGTELIWQRGVPLYTCTTKTATF